MTILSLTGPPPIELCAFVTLRPSIIAGHIKFFTAPFRDIITPQNLIVNQSGPIDDLMPGIWIEAKSSETWDNLIQSHKPTLRADKMEEQVNELVSRLVIPPEWHEMIMVYYLLRMIIPALGD